MSHFVKGKQGLKVHLKGSQVYHPLNGAFDTLYLTTRLNYTGPPLLYHHHFVPFVPFTKEGKMCVCYCAEIDYKMETYSSSRSSSASDPTK